MSIDPFVSDKIRQALETIHSYRSTNQTRSEAQSYLDTLKSEPTSPIYGYQLAVEKDSQPDVIRHFGLSLLENAIKHHWNSYSDLERTQIQQWSIALATRGTREISKEAHFIKEKVADIFVQIAERTWLASWHDMDEILQNMWNQNDTTRHLSLIILTMLIEDNFGQDEQNQVVHSRAAVISNGLLSITASSNVLHENYPEGIKGGNQRIVGWETTDNDGWLVRWGNALGKCLTVVQTGHGTIAEEVEKVGIAVLKAIRSCLGWALTKAIKEAGILPLLCSSLLTQNVTFQTVAVDCLFVLLSREISEDDDMSSLVATLFTPDSLTAFQGVYNDVNIKLNPQSDSGIEEDSYILLKKIVETLVLMGRSKYLPKENLNRYFSLLIETTKHPSPVVSHASLDYWVNHFNTRGEISPYLIPFLPQLLELATERTMRYEDMKSSSNIVKAYLNIDLENLPELHAFCGNYRRSMVDIIKLIVFHRPFDTVTWLISRFPLPSVVQGITEKTSDRYLQLDAMFVACEATVGGIRKWDQSKRTPRPDGLNGILTNWARIIFEMNIEDPLILKRQLQCLSAFARVLEGDTDLVFRILEKIYTLLTATVQKPENIPISTESMYSDLRTAAVTEVRRLASTNAATLATILPQLENVVSDCIINQKVNDRDGTDLQSALLIVNHRSKLSSEQKRLNFDKIVEPILAEWSGPERSQQLSSLDGFMDLMMITDLLDYLKPKRIEVGIDLTTIPIDAPGRALVERINGFRYRLWATPIRSLRKFVEDTFFDTKEGTSEYQWLQEYWIPRIERAIPNILLVIKQLQAYFAAVTQQTLPSEVQYIMSKTIEERFWLHGVSVMSKEEFMTSADRARNTLQELIDAYNHFIRRTREYSFIAVGSLSVLGASYYHIPDLANQILHASFETVDGLSLHGWTHVINSSLRPLLKRCPVSNRESFLGQMIPPVLAGLNAILTREWARMTARGLSIKKEDESFEGKISLNSNSDLSDDMMEESLLRLLTYTAMKFAGDLVEQTSHAGKVFKMCMDVIPAGHSSLIYGVAQQRRNDSKTTQQSVRAYTLSNNRILEGLLTLCSNVIKIHDTRSSRNSAHILRNIIPELSQNAHVREFVGEQVLQSTLEALNEEYFVEIQDDILHVIAGIYITFRFTCPAPRMVFSRLPGITEEQLKKLDERLSVTRSVRTQRLLIANFLEPFKGHAPSERHKQINSYGPDVSTKTLLRRLQQEMGAKPESQAETNTNNVLNGDADRMIAGLFDQN
ncbi:hypothetical protein NEOLI_000987 [Neolecta irregularis DAH-3]|uniref:Uncharacterized protein n=1 Tax=Neolecta irregularis (strain DAH-3) TaxID=1198029 RepID=A0A1U7LGV2_NEOID|nr:hypothetical protein NEOLI_000987 [Neolecta irregularis DAH-3]|eukprot:OLL21885.1 hypothetical protein NEOLI_000987 [Neolecta irregularis DAH-3]